MVYQSGFQKYVWLMRKREKCIFCLNVDKKRENVRLELFCYSHLV